MSDIVIKAENLGKMYTIGHQAKIRHYVALRDVVMQKARTFWNKTKDLAMGKAIIQGDAFEEIWALKDVNFEIKRGEAVGIIGRNGAGKSTLLKVLSRITEPSTGRVTIKGRVASLLEVGTGFHPELTGRENIYLNGTILGMTRAEIKSKFDEIVAFADMERFLDTPVKRYSSGMYMRLAFAVAAHLEPEILVIDEVLSVGDAEFQKKCLGKMEEIGKGGRTILFVSHNMGAVRSLCSSGILLSNGSIRAKGKIGDIISGYLSANIVLSSVWSREGKIPSRRGLFLVEIRILNNEFVPSGNIADDQCFYIDIVAYATSPIKETQVAFRVTNHEGIHIFTSANSDGHKGYLDCKTGSYRYRVCIPGEFLMPGKYSILVASMVPAVELFDIVEGKLSFFIDDFTNTMTNAREKRLGVVAPVLKWEQVFNEK